MREVWKDILGFDGYQISDQGRVRTSKWRTGLEKYRLMVPQLKGIPGNQYLCIFLISPNRQRRQYSLHRLLHEVFIGPVPDGWCVDHIDRNPLNNSLENLRAATRSQNGANSRKRANRKHKYKGTNQTRNGKWEARSTYKKKMIYLGRFDTEEEAAKAYNEYGLETFGKFAVLNILPEEIN